MPDKTRPMTDRFNDNYGTVDTAFTEEHKNVIEGLAMKYRDGDILMEMANFHLRQAEEARTQHRAHDAGNHARTAAALEAMANGIDTLSED